MSVRYCAARPGKLWSCWIGIRFSPRPFQFQKKRSIVPDLWESLWDSGWDHQTTNAKPFKGMAGTTGLEPAASAVTGQRSNQLNYVPACFHRVTGKPSIFLSFLTCPQSRRLQPISAPYNRTPGVNGQETVRKHIPTSPDREAYDPEHLSMPRA